jgi:hypothetical protein
MPLTDEELNDKYMELATPVLGVAGARKLLEQLWRTEQLASADFDIDHRAPARAAG